MSKKRILLIDDERNLCDIMRVNLERDGGYEVETAYSGLEGIQKATAADFDLVITDLKMPCIGGDIVLEALKAIKPHSPVVICSVYHDDTKTISRTIREKADAIIGKPIDHHELYQAIEQALTQG